MGAEAVARVDRVAAAGVAGGAVGLARRLLPLLPALALAFPLLVWPLVEQPPSGDLENFTKVAPTSEPSQLNRFYFLPLFALTLSLALAAPRQHLRRLGHPAILLLGLFLAWAALSSSWSLDGGVALRRLALQITVLTPMLLPVLLAERPEAVLDHVFWLIAAVVGINLAAVVIGASGSLGHQGLYPQKNILGAVMAGAVLVASALLIGGRGLKRAIAAIVIVAALAVLVASRSKTSLGLVILAPAIAMALSCAWRVMRVSPALLVPLAFGLGCGVYVAGVEAHWWTFEGLATALFGDPTLTRRTDIWAFAVDMIAQRPLLGWGYETFWGLSYEAPSYRQAPGFVADMPHAHNGYLDILIHVGAVGFALLLLLILAVLHLAGRLGDRAAGPGFLCLSIAVFSILYNLLESTWFHGFSMVWMSFVLALGLGVAMRRTSP